MEAQRQLPQYQCHKKVWALKIAAITDPNQATDGSRLLEFAEPGYDPICVTGAFMDKHNPQPGGYYVVYDDDYKSYSPAKAFKDGYTRI